MSTPSVVSSAAASVTATGLAATAAPFKNILFSTDFSEFSMKALPWVTGLARKFGSNVFLCHVVTPTPLAVGAPEAAPYLYQAETESADRALKDLLASERFKGLAVKSVMPSGPLADELGQVIAENNINLVVAGTHGRSGVRRLLLGSAVEEICRVATCPVLTVGPDLAVRTDQEIKHILVPTDLSEESKRSLPYVALLAKAYGAKVTVLHIMPLDAATNPDAKMLSEPVRRSMVHAYEPFFVDIKPEFVIEFGNTVETILTHARKNHVDLIGLGIRSAFLPGFQLRSSVAYRVISGAHCPVLTCR